MIDTFCTSVTGNSREEILAEANDRALVWFGGTKFRLTGIAVESMNMADGTNIGYVARCEFVGGK